MPRTETVLRVFVSSPNDVAAERECIEEVIREFNLTWSKNLSLRLDLIKWETHAFPSIGDDSQDVINEQISDDYDIFVGILWKRFGTPTNRSDSGTVEEFELAYEIYKSNPDQIRIMFYFNDSPIAPSEIDPGQLILINQFRDKLGKKGNLYWTYKDRDEFSSLIRLHLSRQLQEWQKSWGLSETHSMILEKSKEVNLFTVESDTTESEEEDGLLDLLEIGDENFKKLNDISQRMANAIEDIGTKMNLRTKEIDRMQIDKSYNYITIAKRIFKNAAEDMDEFVKRMEVEIPIFKDSYSNGIHAFARLASLSREFQVEDQQEISDTLEEVQIFSSTLTSTLESMLSFRTSVVNLPRVSKVFNKAKRNTVNVLDSLIYEINKAINLASEVEKMLQ